MKRTANKLRLHIGIFGKRNAGKSSVFNQLVRHEAAIVSEEPGTTTDPVKKSMEHHFLGPILVIDTAGLDDTGKLGELRTRRAKQILKSIDFAIIVTTPGKWDKDEDELLKQLNIRKIPFVVCINKTDSIEPDYSEIEEFNNRNLNYVLISAKTGKNIPQLMNVIENELPSYWYQARPIVRDLFQEKEILVLVAPDDYQAAATRIPIAYNRIIRDCLDNDAQCVVTGESQLGKILKALKQKPKVVIADSKIWENLIDQLDGEMIFSSIPAIFARYRGDLHRFTQGAKDLAGSSANLNIHITDFTHKSVNKPTDQMQKTTEKIEQFTRQNHKYIYCGRKDFPGHFNDNDFIVLFNEEEVTKEYVFDKIEKARLENIPMTNYDILRAVFNESNSRILKFKDE
ncbi:MAG: GTP-binding protein [Vulcanimicrobiota bacterium]